MRDAVGLRGTEKERLHYPSPQRGCILAPEDAGGAFLFLFNVDIENIYIKEKRKGGVCIVGLGKARGCRPRVFPCGLSGSR